MDAQKYIKETEHAARQLFDGIAYYRNILEKIPDPVFIFNTSSDNKEKWEKEFVKWYESNKKEIEKSKEKLREYFALSFFEATLCGSILQIAFMAIDLFSRNKIIPKSCSSFIKPKHKKAIKFCIGREVRGLPIGIIIYAARNQYNHWDDPSPRPITKAVFDILATSHGYGHFKDPAFDLSNPYLDIYTHNILALLEWKSYEAYVKDIQKLIC